jgi:hypothetical protein
MGDTFFSLVCVHRISLVLVCRVIKSTRFYCRQLARVLADLRIQTGVSAESQATRLLTFSATVAGATVRRQMVVLETHGELVSS